MCSKLKKGTQEWDEKRRFSASFKARVALEDALLGGAPRIFNTGQGSQCTGRVLASGARMSMDGRGRHPDNIFIERLWRSLKYECVYPHELIGAWLDFHNHVRPPKGWQAVERASLPPPGCLVPIIAGHGACWPAMTRVNFISLRAFTHRSTPYSRRRTVQGLRSTSLQPAARFFARYSAFPNRVCLSYFFRAAIAQSWNQKITQVSVGSAKSQRVASFLPA